MKVTDRLHEIYEATAPHYDLVVSRARLPHFLTLARLLQLEGTERVLDVGCGPGNLTRELLPQVASAVGVDTSPAMIEQARARLPLAEWRVADATDTGCSEASFDVVVSSQLLPWLPDPTAFFAEVRRVLRPGGRFGLITSASSNYREFFQALERLLKTYDEYYQTDSPSQVWGSRTYTAAQLEAFLRGAGLRLEDWVLLQTEVASTPEAYLEVMRMFTDDHYLYPIPQEYRAKAKAELTEYLRRDGLTLNERAIILAARRP